MALRFFDGFDYYSTADLASRYNIAGSGFHNLSTSGRFSSGAVQGSGTGGGEQLCKFFSNQTTFVIGFAYKFDTGGKQTMIANFSEPGGLQCELKMNTSNQLIVTTNGTQRGVGGTTLLPNTFYYIEFKATCGSSGAYEARLNGVTEVSGTANTNPQVSGIYSRVSICYDNFQVGVVFDDYYICDGTGSSNNDFLGDMRCETLLPSGQGYYNEWSYTGGSSNWQAVSESNEDGDTSYVASNTLNQRESYLLPDLSSTPTLIAGVQITGVVRKDDAGDRAITPLFRISSTDYLGTQQGIPDSYAWLTSVYDINPATSAAWVGSDFSSAQIGFKLTK